MRTLNRWFLGGFLALLVCSGGLFAADGKYQKAKDGKTMVWNSEPKAGDTATWSGKRDDEGYATGHGTLTWYVAKPNFLTGSNIPASKSVVYGEYTGKMVHGKLEGTVNVKAKGKLAHATFKNGARDSLWLSGTADEDTIAKKSATPAPEKIAEPEAPAVGPTPSLEVKTTPNKSVPPPPPPTTAQPREMDDSLKSLVGPPALLHDRTADPAPQADAPAAAPQSAPPTAPTNAAPPASSSAPAAEKPSASGPVLNKSDAIEIAASEARTQGYDPSQYPAPRAYYVAADDSWSVFYDQKSSADGMAAAGKRFIVTVEDKSRKASITGSK